MLGGAWYLTSQTGFDLSSMIRELGAEFFLTPRIYPSFSLADLLFGLVLGIVVTRRRGPAAGAPGGGQAHRGVADDLTSPLLSRQGEGAKRPKTFTPFPVGKGDGGSGNVNYQVLTLGGGPCYEKDYILHARWQR